MSERELTSQQRAAETKRRRTREKIVSGTLDLYSGLDQGDFTLSQIAEAGGVGTATIPYHFPTKYDVLRAAHDRLLSPVIEPIVATDAEGTYNPPDRVAELVRYVHAVATVSDAHRALTVGMVCAFFETAPEQESELLNITSEDAPLDIHLAGYIAAGMVPILDGEPFSSGNGRYVNGSFSSSVSLKTVLYHANGLLLSLYHSASLSTPIDVTLAVCGELLRATSPDADLSTVQIHLDRFRKKKELRQRIFKRVKVETGERIFYMELLSGGHLREWQEEDESDAWVGKWETYMQDGEPVLEVVVGDYTTKFMVDDEELVGSEKSHRASDGQAKTTLQFIDAGLDPEGWMQRVHAWSDR